ncbi:MAG: hypothetical protein ACJ75H_10955 [Thermoanaerobaculia bacterium]
MNARFLLIVPLLVLYGCGSSLPPPRLTGLQAATVDRIPAGSLGVVAVEVERPIHAENLRAMLERTRLFKSAVLAGEAAETPDYVARITDRCSYRRGGFIPLWSILTLGVVPTFSRMELAYAFTLRETATGREARIPCEISSVQGIGWLPAAMNVLPGWTYQDPEESKRFERRLAYAIVSRTPEK